jgi:hypothetical protein
MQAGDDMVEVLDREAHFLGEILDLLGVGRDELVQGRVEQADGDGTALHGLVDGLEVALLHRLELLERLFALLGGLGDDHLADGADAVGLEEHVLGAAEADALGAEGGRLRGVVRRVGVGADLQAAELVRPAHDAAEVAGDAGRGGLDLLAVDVAGGAVDGEVVALFKQPAAELEFFLFLVDLDGAAAGDAAGAHAARDDGRVGGHAAADGQHALRVVHALDVLRGGLEADQHDLGAVLGPVGRGLGGEDDLAAGGAGRGGEAGAEHLGLFERGLVEGAGAEARRGSSARSWRRPLFR